MTNISKLNMNCYLIMLTFLLSSIGCSHQRVQSHLRFVDDPSNKSTISLEELKKARKSLFKNNQEKIKSTFKDEWKFNRIPNKPPQLGLALSGGGVRSANFSIGVMKALHEQGILQNIDVISSVSGGSYALHWYYMQQYYIEENCARTAGDSNKNCSVHDIFKAKLNEPYEDKYDHRFQTHLEKSSDLLIIGRPPEYLRYAYIGTAELLKYISTIPFIPVNWIVNGLFDWDANVFPFRRYYQNAIERTYGLAPIDEEAENFLNDELFLIFPKTQAKKITFSEISDFLIKRAQAHNNFQSGTVKNNLNTMNPRLPFFVVNTTAGHDRLGTILFKDLNDQIDEAPQNTSASNKIFEFTPLGYGSEVFGYGNFKENKSLENEIHFSKAVAISGAAVDYQAFTGLGKGAFIGGVLRGLNLNLGYSIDNYNITTSEVVENNLSPFPFYLIDNYKRANPSPPQGEEKKNFQFPSKHSTKIRLSDGGQSENLGILSLIRRGVKHIIAVDAENDICKSDKKRVCFGSLNKLEETLKQEYGIKITWKDLNKNESYIKNATQSVFRGTITGLDGNNKVLSTLTYIKLIYNEATPCKGLPKNCSIEEWTTNEKKWDFFSNPNDFPQRSTIDVFYEPPQVRAYRDLGYQTSCSNQFNEKLKANLLLYPITPMSGNGTCTQSSN